MKRRTFIKHTGAAGLIAFITPYDAVQSFNQSIDTLEKNFIAPPTQAYPQAYWFWMNGNITREGITLDLEAMKKVGVGGVFNFDAGTGIPKGPVEYLSDEWLELKKHAIREAARLGLEFTMHNCPGWSASGGPWITPAMAMQQVSWSETYTAGGKPVTLQLPKPLTRFNHYRDVAVVAFPSLEGEDLMQTVKLSSSSSATVDKEKLTGSEEGVTVQPAAKDEPAWLQFEFSRPFEARLITFFISAPDKSVAGKPLEFGERTSIRLEASDDGVQFNLVTQINTGLNTELAIGDKYIVYDIPVMKARYFRITSSKTRRYKQVQFSGITRLKNWMEKTNTRARNFATVEETSTINTNNNQQVPAASVIDISTIIDISRHVDANGKLNWDAPAGNWTILRMGYTPNGTLNRAAPETGIGLECDKYNPEAISFHFNKMMENLLPEMKTLAVKGKAGLSIDSYEAGTQNWTAGFEQLFLKRSGYDIVQYLPILAGGRIVDGVEVTEGFLWDLRKVQSALIAENYYGKFHQLSRRHNITTYIEPYDSGPMEEMLIGSKVDSNMGEFWTGISSMAPIKHPALRTVKLAASIAHINGQKVTGAEAFTGEPDSAKWQEYPFALKALGDKFFTLGTNRLVIHRYAHQPHPSAVPGMTMGPWGIHFDRTNTLWNQGREWLRYLSRCQGMLQQGRFAADLAYFTGEDANMYTRVNAENLHPFPPAGYDYDLINADVILKQVKIVNNNIALPNGMTYRVFILQDYKAVTLALLRKLRSLVQEGMILIGDRPERSAGISNGDAIFKLAVEKIWGNINGTAITEHSFGRGRVFWGLPLKTVLEKLKIAPKFEYTSHSGDAPLRYIHRKIADGDIYFISNQRRTFEATVCTFRVRNKQPELWDAATGKIIPAPMYELSGDRIRMPIQLEPYGSVFVVFRKPAANAWLSVEKNGKALLSAKNFSPQPPELYKDIADNFTILFWAKPEINVLLNPDFIMGTIKQPWTDYYALYPFAGHEIHGDEHAICGITVGRNGVAVWERTTGDPVLVLAAAISISGWNYIGVVYKDGIPSVYFNGEIIKSGAKSKSIVHPAPQGLPREGASYYNGDMAGLVVLKGANLGAEILSVPGKPAQGITSSPFEVEISANAGKPSLLVKQNGVYSLRNSHGKTTRFIAAGIDPPITLSGRWNVNFPANAGAPAEVALNELASLHLHHDIGVSYFSGTATYIKNFMMPKGSLGVKRWILDLGSVEVIAEVIVNGKNFGILWKRPYSVDITEAMREGSNKLEVKVTNQWTNRLIGDEQLRDPDKFTPGGGSSGLQGLTGGSIEKLPDWYKQSKQKPDDGRITFTTWKHYHKDSPLLPSGLIGPVTLQCALLGPL